MLDRVDLAGHFEQHFLAGVLGILRMSVATFMSPLIPQAPPAGGF